MANYIDLERVERILQRQGRDGLSSKVISELTGADSRVINRALVKRPERFECLGGRPIVWKIRR